MSRSSVPNKRPAEAQEAAWVADEDRFVLQQAKTKAAIRVKGNRAQPIDWLAVTLAVIDPQRNPLDEELKDGDLEMVDPESVFDGLSDAQLGELAKGIETYVVLETSRSNLEYWNMMKTICEDRRKSARDRQPTARGVGSIATDLDKLLGPKNLEELEKLEKQIRAKLDSHGPIDTDYWEHLLRSLLTYKARAKLRTVSRSVLDARVQNLRKQEIDKAQALKTRLESTAIFETGITSDKDPTVSTSSQDRHRLDPEPMLRLRPEDRTLESMSLKGYTDRLEDDRKRVRKAGYVPQEKPASDAVILSNPDRAAKRPRIDGNESTSTTLSAFDREVARGLGENEELFTQEVHVTTKSRAQWPPDVKPRQPKSFNRVQLGYEWNKYNQTHYDHDNLPPRVVQGYKFNIFYPDLLDKVRAPTYRIEREGGRRRGQLSAPAGEDDTCVIRFVAGPPYEDIAFRIVDKEWDYSAKRERGFRSSFDRGILQLHFQFKKIYYRK